MKRNPARGRNNAKATQALEQPLFPPLVNPTIPLPGLTIMVSPRAMRIANTKHDNAKRTVMHVEKLSKATTPSIALQTLSKLYTQPKSAKSKQILRVTIVATDCSGIFMIPMDAVVSVLEFAVELAHPDPFLQRLSRPPKIKNQCTKFPYNTKLCTSHSDDSAYHPYGDWTY